MGLFQCSLYKLGHDNVAVHVAVFAQVETLARDVEAEFDGCCWLSRKASSNAPFFFDIQTQGRVYMRLHAIKEVVEAGVVCDVSRDSGYITDSICRACQFVVKRFSVSGAPVKEYHMQ